MGVDAVLGFEGPAQASGQPHRARLAAGKTASRADCSETSSVCVMDMVHPREGPQEAEHHSRAARRQSQGPGLDAAD